MKMVPLLQEIWDRMQLDKYNSLLIYRNNLPLLALTFKDNFTSQNIVLDIGQFNKKIDDYVKNNKKEWVSYARNVTTGILITTTISSIVSFYVIRQELNCNLVEILKNSFIKK